MRVKFILRCIVLVGCVSVLLSGCKKSDHFESLDDLGQIKQSLKQAGFDTSFGFYKHRDGYIVENDIYLTLDQIKNLDSKSNQLIDLTFGDNNSKDNVGKVNGKISHYGTSNSVLTNLSKRTISVYIDPYFSSYYQACLDSAINRYNAVDFGLSFTRVYNINQAEIKVVPTNTLPAGVLGESGFPSGGIPYQEVRLSTSFFNNSTYRADGIAVIAHEIGHCIGFRHTDAINRAYSCGSGGNEGAAGVGLNHIPYTPTGGSPESWMLACSQGYDRPFTAADIIALKTKYSYKKNIYVKVIETVNYDNSYSGGTMDIIDRSITTTLKFYQDAALTIPYYTNNYFVITLYDVGSGGYSAYIFPNGVSSHSLGETMIHQQWDYGELAYDYGSYGTAISYSPYYNLIY